ncbi:MAG: TAXI family TRAP transporter solute-binding subunit [Stenotrophobium sp.]
MESEQKEDAVSAHDGRVRDPAQLRLLSMIPRVSWRDLAATLGPVLILGALALMIAIHLVRPAPPRTLTISSGPAGSTFNSVAGKYRKILARSGIKLVVLTSAGSLDNLNRLTDPRSNVDIALVQGGVTGNGDISGLVSLGSVFYEPLTIFYRSPTPILRLSQFKGKRISIGLEGSGTRFLALALLKANGIQPQNSATLLGMEGDAAMKALLDRRVDAIFLSGDSAAPGNIHELLHASGIRLFDFTQADAYVRRFRYLSKLNLPPGSFDLGDNLPQQPINMLAPTVELLAHTDLHPALSDLLIEAAREVNGHATLLQNAGEFPAPLLHAYPISDDAQRYYKSGKSIAYRYLPFWLASLLDRALVVLVPFLVVIIPGLRLVPALYGWRVKNRIYRRYGDLMALERAALEPLTPEQKKLLIARLGEIEKASIGAKIPGAFADQIYVLRQHIKFVREQLARD